MKALVLKQEKSLPEFTDYPEPKAKVGEVIVELRAASLNHRDLWMTKGRYPNLQYPAVLGSCGAGMLGTRRVIINPSFNWSGNTPVQPIDYQILGMPTDGTFAERIAIPERLVYNAPEHLNFAQAGALPLAGLTAYRALFTKGRCKAGDTVLISGVGGGVALFATQYAIAAGAKVIVTSSSQKKIDRAVKMGAIAGFKYTDEQWEVNFKKQFKGADIVIDSAAGPGFKKFISLANPGARIVFFGGTRGTITELDPPQIFWKQLEILGTTMGNDEEFKAMLDFVNRHKIVPVVDEIFSLENGLAAFAKMKEGTQFGKLVLSISH